MKATLATFASLALSLALAAAAGGTQNSLPLSSRVIQRGELRGFGPFRPGADRTLYRTARQWIGLDSSITRAEASAEMTRLRRLRPSRARRRRTAFPNEERAAEVDLHGVLGRRDPRRARLPPRRNR